MNNQAVLYAVLRDRDSWDESVHWAGLQRQPDGSLMLPRLPGLIDGRPIVVPGGFVAKPSGLAVGDYQDLYLASTTDHEIIAIDGTCNARFILGQGGPGNAPGQFREPRSLLIVNDNLYVADSGNKRVQVFRLPSLELRAVWEGPLKEPVGLAADSVGRVYILDLNLESVLRFSPDGVLDTTYNTALATTLRRHSPVSLAVDDQDTLYVVQLNTVLRFNRDGDLLPAITGTTPAQPRVMTARADRVYVADEYSGRIWVYDRKTSVFVSSLADYRGPVAALALDESGALYIKPDSSDTYYCLQADAACVSKGVLTAGPFDAGIASVWERVHAEFDLPQGTQAELRMFAAHARGFGPQEASWGEQTLAPALDTLVVNVPFIAALPLEARRYLWLQITIYCDDSRRVSPCLFQVQAETTGESYLDYLPAVYRREDAPQGFLERWLALFRAKLGDLEFKLEDMPRHFNPVTAPNEQLRWLATWLAFDPPDGLAERDLRSLLTRIYALHDRRGTPQGLCDFIELYTGVRPTVFEAFRERHIWQLGTTSTLGFDTALAAGLPDGMIVPGFTQADPGYLGLRGDYYDGINFEKHVLSRTDTQVNFDWTGVRPDAMVPLDNYSVRWTGQVLPRYSERYTFHVTSDDGVRLYVDGLLIINQWKDQPQTEYSATIELIASRWYAIQIEYYEKHDGAVIRLAWSSRSLPREVIPHDRLYSVRDELAKIEPPEQSMIVGQTVVGESGPLNQASFGMPLFSDTAHLFTIIVPAGALPTAAGREMLQRILEMEKPAHTDYHLCFPNSEMRIGWQARVGIDSIVGGPPSSMELSGTMLGWSSYLGGDDEPSGNLGQ